MYKEYTIKKKIKKISKIKRKKEIMCKNKEEKKMANVHRLQNIKNGMKKSQKSRQNLRQNESII